MPSENDWLLESYWAKAANKLGWLGFAMPKNAMTFLKSRQSSAPSHLISETRNIVQDFYNRLHKQPAEVKAKVSNLLSSEQAGGVELKNLRATTRYLDLNSAKGLRAPTDYLAAIALRGLKEAC
ncbi:hypothetical protein HOY82DRAFT_542396 [Tuber indicum]|nr:hypothetical protein HOY82DRAFT_542396 [Tuber indicum]